MEFTNVKWHTDLEGNNIAYKCTMNGQPEVHIPLDPANRHYVEIMRQVEAEELTIAPAEGG